MGYYQNPKVTVYPEVMTLGAVTYRPVSRSVTYLGKSVRLPPGQSIIFYTMASKIATLFSVSSLCAAVYGPNSTHNTKKCRTIAVFVCEMRKKLKKIGAEDILVSVKGYGYYLRPTEASPC